MGNCGDYTICFHIVKFGLEFLAKRDRNSTRRVDYRSRVFLEVISHSPGKRPMPSKMSRYFDKTVFLSSGTSGSEPTAYTNLIRFNARLVSRPTPLWKTHDVLKCFWNCMQVWCNQIHWVVCRHADRVFCVDFRGSFRPKEVNVLFGSMLTCAPESIFILTNCDLGPIASSAKAWLRDLSFMIETTKY